MPERRVRKARAVRKLFLVMAVALAMGMALPALAQGGFGIVDTQTGVWYLRDPENGATTQFFYGNPGDIPMVGDWDCDGDETPGLYRQADGFVYLRNSNSQGVADIRFFFGNPGDVPLAGDFDNDDCDTVSIYRPSESRVFIINRLGANEGGLGAAEHAYYFGNPGDKPFVGDFNGDGVDTIGLHRESTGLVYFRQSHTQGNADAQFIFGDPGDKIMAADWIANGVDTVGLLRPSLSTIYLRYSNTQGNADFALLYGLPTGLPVAGEFGALPGGGVAPAPPPPVVTFGNGTHRVGINIPSGTYRNFSSSFCYGARLSGLGGSLDEIIGNEIGPPHMVVTIQPGDVAFESSLCNQRWTNNLSPIKSPTDAFSDGTFFVGSEVAPGLWGSTVTSGFCYWERKSGFSWTLDDIIDNDIVTEGTAFVQVSPSDLGFLSDGCGTWTYLGP